MSNSVENRDLIPPFSWLAQNLWYSEYYHRYVLPTQKDYRRNQIVLDERIY